MTAAARSGPAATSREPIAIVGMACRLPGAADLEQYWELLRTGRDAVGAAPEGRFSVPDGLGVAREGGFLPGLDLFDPAFFGISPREAAFVDPQQRLLLELTWEALEDGGLVPTSLAGTRTGVYVGMWLSDYEQAIYRSTPDIDFHMTTGGGRYAASGRLSYFFDWRGPSLTVDTACSSSLVAVHLACRSLWAGESQLAVAAGVNVMLEPQISTAYARAQLLSPRGRCRFADADADGYVRSDGACVIVLKPLSRAIADGDRVRALIAGTAINNDGRGSGLLVAPSIEGQQAMLREAYHTAGISPARVQYVEAHGTGTRVGDPVELAALAAVLGEGRGVDDRCAVGSVKTNIGHTESAAGLAGLVKTVLAMEHARIPASLHLVQPNPAVSWASVPLELVPSARPWPASAAPRVAGVSAFGITGTNAHVVLMDHGADARAAAMPDVAAPAAPRETQASAGADPRLLLVSAKTAEALRAATAAQVQWLRSSSTRESFADACYTAAARRTHHDHRVGVVAATADEAAEALEHHLGSGSHHAVVAGVARGAARPGVVFVFPGQGAQWPGMARVLIEHEPTFREACLRCSEAVRAHTGWATFDRLAHGEPWGPDTGIDVVQPTLFCVQVAFATLWRSWGVQPAAVIGHSMGEVAAAHVTGALSLEDAALVIGRRSALLKETSGRGAMAVVELSAAEARAAIGDASDRLSVAACNGPRSTVIAGEAAALDELVGSLERAGAFVRRVKVDVASHSPQMDVLRERLLDALADLTPRAPSVPFWSTVDGCATNAPLDAEYWWRNLRQPVLFAQTASRAVEEGLDVFVEMSPHPLLSGALDDIARATGRSCVTVTSGRRDEDDRRVMLGAAAALHAAGVGLDWSRLHGRGGSVVSLPAYPWQRSSFWYETPSGRARDRSGHGDASRELESALQPGTTFREWTLSIEREPTLADHRVRGRVVVPAAAMVDWALTTARSRLGTDAVRLAGFAIAEAIELTSPRTMQIVARPAQPGWNGEAGELALALLTRATSRGEWTAHATARLRPAVPAHQREPLSAIRARLERDEYAVDHDRGMRRRGHEYGPAFRGVAALWRGVGEAFAHLALPAPSSGETRVTAASLIDACFQVLVAAETRHPTNALLPVGLTALDIWGPLPSSAWVHARLDVQGAHPADEDTVGDIVVYDSGGTAVFAAQGLRLRRMGRAPSALSNLIYERRWQRGQPPEPRPARTENRWLVLADDAKVRGVLASALGAYGEVSAPAIGLGQPDALGEVLAARTVDGVVCVWGPSDDPAGAAGTRVIELLDLVQGLVATERTESTRLWLVTRGAHVVVDGDEAAPELTALWAMGGVVNHELPALRTTRVDVHTRDGEGGLEALARAVAAAGPLREMAIRGEAVWTPRIDRMTLPDVRRVVPDEGTACEIGPLQLGVIDRFTWRARPRRAVAPGEVEIDVAAMGLNFMNVLAALRSFPGTRDGSGPLGLECAGVVCAVGPGVTNVAIGDRVMALTHESACSHAMADARLVVRVPTGLALETAATLPVAFVTAFVALEHLARIRPAETVLIHAGTGGVGLAALQVARSAGAHVLATAGSPEKRAWLRDLGVEHVFDSRSTTFAADVIEATKGAGVDVVLNALSGDAIAAGLSTLAPYGRFIELGKRDLYANSEVGLFPLRRNVSLHVLDVDAMCRERPAEVGGVLSDVASRFEAGSLHPLPVRTVHASEAAEAFQSMAHARHVGKLAISTREADGTRPLVEEGLRLRADGTYLVTGGLGALGLAVAARLVERGARHLRLVGRHAPDADASRAIDALRAAGAEVVVESCDVAEQTQVRALVDRIRESPKPLRGIVHAAGILDDGFAQSLTADRARRVLEGKVCGAWHLHELTAGVPLDFFVLFSSVASVLGTPGQAAYAAANGFLDGLAARRRAVGLTATSVSWGPWAEIGLAAEHDRTPRLEAQGVFALPPDRALAACERILAVEGTADPVEKPKAERVAHVVAMDFDVTRWLAAHPSDAEGGVFEALGTHQSEGHTPNADGENIVARLERTAPGRARRQLLQSFVQDHVAAVLRTTVAHVDPLTPLRTLGFDSLMTLELRNRFETACGVRLPATLVWNYPTVSDMVPYLGERIGIPIEYAPAPTKREPPPDSSTAEPLATASAADVSALLAAELDAVDDLLRGS